MPNRPYQAFKFRLPDDLSAKVIEKSRHTPEQTRAAILEEGLLAWGLVTITSRCFSMSLCLILTAYLLTSAIF